MEHWPNANEKRCILTKDELGHTVTKSIYGPPNSFEDAESNAQRRTYNDH